MEHSHDAAQRPGQATRQRGRRRPLRLGRALRDERTTLPDLVRAFVEEPDRITPKRRSAFVQAVSARLDTAFEDDDILDPLLGLHPEFLRAHAADLGLRFLPIVSGEVFEEGVLVPPGPNEGWMPPIEGLTDGPPPERVWNAMGQPQRDALRLLRAEGADLVVRPPHFQTVREEASCVAELSVRSFAQHLLCLPVEQPDRPLVVVADWHNGDNFAHFLLDWTPRLLHLCRHRPALSREAVFVMGPHRRPIHDLVISLLQERFGLDDRQFLFASDPRRLRAPAGVYGFSNHLRPAHPALSCHPETLALLRDLLAAAPSAGMGNLRRAFLSRADASRRRLLNEDAIVERLQALGVRRVVLSALPLPEQIGVARNAELLVGPHGMALALMLFAPGGTRIVELFNPRRGTTAYMALARALGMPYAFTWGPNIPHPCDDHWIDPPAVERLVGEML